MSLLTDILNYKKEEIKNIKIPDIEREKKLINPVKFLREKPIIAEIKKASPSLGDINLDCNIIEVGKKYEKYGAGAISILTDKNFFKGNFLNLKIISNSVNLPLLCKDFIISEKQIEIAYLNGADFILLIASILNEKRLKELSRFAQKLNLKILYEIHEKEEFKKIKNLDLELVGVNSRDLKTMKIDKLKAKEIIKKINGSYLKVAESGIENCKDIESFKQAGADAFLIGTSLMKSKNIHNKFKEFYSCL